MIRMPRRAICRSAVAGVRRQAMHSCTFGNVSRRVRPGTTKITLKANHSARNKSMWNFSRSLLGGYRCKTFWHQPGCSWVASSGDPRNTPRDKDCPACQEGEGKPFELSARELVWQRQWEQMRRFLEREPYNALFGCSNDRLHGKGFEALNRRLQHLSSIHVGMSAQQEREIENLAAAAEAVQNPPNTVGSADKPKAAASTPPPPSTTTKLSGIERGINHTTRETSEVYTINEFKAQGGNQPVSNDYGTWRVTKESGGQKYEASGELEYDPITMRMVPKPLQASKPAPIVPEPRISAVVIPVKIPSGTQTSTQAPVGDSKATAATSAPKAASAKSDAATTIKVIQSSDWANRYSQLRQRKDGPNPLKRHQDFSNQSDPVTKLAKSRESASQTNGAAIMTKSDSPETSSVDEGIISEAHSQTKKALERSWLFENMSKPAVSFEQDLAFAPTRETASSEKPKLNVLAAAQTAIKSKDKPYKVMSIREMSKHRAALQLLFAKKYTRQKQPETPTEKRLAEEIKQQKLAYTAFEDKWSSRLPSTKPVPVSTVTEPKASTQPLEDTMRGEGDLCANAAKYAMSDRWYKKKAPHASSEAEKRLRQAEEDRLHDRALVREVQKIFEDAYGAIVATPTRHDTAKSSDRASIAFSPTSSHESNSSSSIEQQDTKQQETPTDAKTLGSSPSSSQKQARGSDASGSAIDSYAKTSKLESALDRHTKFQSSMDSETSAKRDPDMYQVLAYDHMTQTVHSAIASASFAPPSGEKILSVSDALVRLSAPAKFLPHLAKHQDTGYEIVSANKNLLVLKRVRGRRSSRTISPTIPRTSSDGMIPPIKRVPRDQLQPQTGNFASPTGFVNHDIYPDTSSLSRPSREASVSNPRVRKNEPVFSGTSRAWHDEPSSSSTDTRTAEEGDRSQSRQSSAKGRKRTSRWRDIKRMLATGIVTAGLCYAIGAASEELREAKRDSPSRAATQSGSPWFSDAYLQSLGVSKTSSEAQIQQAVRRKTDEERTMAAIKTVLAGALVTPVLWYLWGR